MQQKIDWFWVFLKPRGRLTRLPYALAMLGILFVSSAIVNGYINANMKLVEAEVLNATSFGEIMQVVMKSTPGLQGVLQFVAFVTLWPMVALSAKRVQDFGLTGFLGVAIVLPGVSVLAFLALAFVPGAEGPNKNGAVRNAPPNSLS